MGSSKSNKPYKEIPISVLSDVFSMLGVPTNLIGSIFKNYSKRRIEESKRIFFEEMSKGKISNFDISIEDDEIAILQRYALATHQGVAKRNLRLLAKAMVGLSKRDKLYSDEFAKHAAVLESLTRDQTLLLGTIWQFYLVNKANGEDDNNSWSDAWKKSFDVLLPDQFESGHHIYATGCQLFGTGLLFPQAAVGGSNIKNTVFFAELMELVEMNLDELLADD
jgi:hypothetical protein